MWELSRLWCYIVDSPGLNPATNIKSCLFVQRSDIGITFHCEQIKCRNAQSGLRIRHIKCRNTQSLHSAHSRSSVAIHNLFTAHTADQVSQYTISSQRTRQIKCRNIQSLHSAHDRSIVAIHNLFTAHTAYQVSQYTISALRTWWAQRSYAFTVMNVLYLSPLIASLESLSFASRENSS